MCFATRLQAQCLHETGLCPLQEWCRRKGAECLAVQLPGRAMRTAEPFLTSAQQLATELLPVVASRLQDTPYIVHKPEPCKTLLT